MLFVRDPVALIGVLRFVGPKSIQVMFFRGKGWSFSLQDPIFWYFSNFQRLV